MSRPLIQAGDDYVVTRAISALVEAMETAKDMVFEKPPSSWDEFQQRLGDYRGLKRAVDLIRQADRTINE